MAGQVDHTHWSLDKRIPIVLLVGIIGTAVVAHYRLGVVETQVSRIEDRLERDANERRQYDREAASREASVNVALAELRASTQALREGVTELRSAVRMLVPTRNNRGE